MPTWLRSVFGILAGGLNLFANGTNWKQVLVSIAVAGLGIITQLTSVSNLSKPPADTVVGALKRP
jgi:hypothetical protein